MKRFLLLTVIAITLPLILFAFVGCMKNPELKADYGPQVLSEKIEEALNEGASPAPETIKLDQYTSLEGYMVIDTRPPETTYQRLDEVVKYEQPVQDGYKYSVATFNITTRELNGGTWKEFKIGNLGLVVDKEKISANQVLQSRDSKESGLTIQSIQRMAAQEPGKYTFHNLTKETGVMPVPPAVSSKADCGGLPVMVCRNGLRYVKVKFDQVYWETADHGVKTTFTLLSSSDVPTYIESWDNLNPKAGLRSTNQIKGCGQTWMELSDGTNKQTVPVMNCMELRDFQFGHD